MAADRIVLRVDATYGVAVKRGDVVCAGEAVSAAASAQTSCVCPVSGVVQEVRFEPDRHEFVVSIVPNRTE